MQNVTRREAMHVVAATGAAVLGASAVGAAAPPPKKPKANSEPPVASKASPDRYGPRELFAVVDGEGKLRRGLHVVSTQCLALGTYEVIFSRDVRRGVYVATAGGHGYAGVPVPAAISVVGRACDPRGVLVYVTDMEGDPQAG